MLTFLELKELDKNIIEAELHRYFHLEDGIMLQEKLLGEGRSALLAMSGDTCLEWILFEDTEGEWEQTATYSSMAPSSALTEFLVEFAGYTGYIKMNESMGDSTARGFEFDFTDTTLLFADSTSRPAYKLDMSYQFYYLYTLPIFDEKIVSYMKLDKEFEMSEGRKTLLNRSLISLDHKYDMSTFDLVVCAEGCSKIVLDFARLCEKKHGMKLVVDDGKANHYRDKSVLYIQDLCSSVISAKATVDRFAKRGTDELILAELLHCNN